MGKDRTPAPSTLVRVATPTPPAGRWEPVVGAETLTLASDLPAESRENIIEEARQVLARCGRPDETSRPLTGLAIGYVQSGKTMSFTTLAALARDNQYRLVIVLAGTKLNLLDQSRRRLIRDLRLDRDGFNPWLHLDSPTKAARSHQLLRNALEGWHDPAIGADERKTVLITVMKHHGHLRKLIEVLNEVSLDGVHPLIIDDEADQASLNTMVKRGRQSSTYARLLALKGCFPGHTFVQYTATPQAPLLIRITDMLSPAFAEVLTPGPGYVGGRDFFAGANRYVRVIPEDDIPDKDDPPVEPPRTLIEALRLFLVGVAVGIIRDNMSGKRSMMIHPSQQTSPQKDFVSWVTKALQEWKDVLASPEVDPDRAGLLDELRAAHADLLTTDPGLPAFEEIVPRLPRAIRETTVQEANATDTGSTQINWGASYGWVLVGGQAMDRGFTVEGLTVTYMPRDVGQGNVDTIQQRARFFGYKRHYLGLCRVFVGAAVRDAFADYVDHEEALRKDLLEFRDTNQPLWEWRRLMFLDRSLKATRDNVIDRAYEKVAIADKWFWPRSPQYAAEENRALLGGFLSGLTLTPHTYLDRRAGAFRIRASHDVSLELVQRQLLTGFRLTESRDSFELTPLLWFIKHYLAGEHSSPPACSVFLMAPEDDPRERACSPAEDPDPDDPDDSEPVYEIDQLFQGRQYAGGQISYEGDREICSPGRISVQIHYLDLKDGTGGKAIARKVPAIAAHVPAAIAQDLMKQRQGAWT